MSSDAYLGGRVVVGGGGHIFKPFRETNFLKRKVECVNVDVAAINDSILLNSVCEEFSI
ncbi:hypothetical protein Lalb_Chr21g0319021 [Lupinus albus]|uniref:Uncharacterized protein n=1 Tax=Lupinus albus TaxID=3870 RepID=A0A6A4NHY2_LUPAL|nr:hypothetical protein Lalb_Chr21g0319021 [Lupinus albus]